MLKIVLVVATALTGSLAASAEPEPPATSSSAEAVASAEKSVRGIVATVRRQLAKPGEPFALLVMLRVKPGQFERVLASYALQKTQAAVNPGNLLYSVNRDTADPARIVLYEHWAGFEAFHRHETSPETLAHFARIASALEDERSLVVLTDPFAQ